jgi:predicted ATPase
VAQAYTRAQELCQQIGATSQLFHALWGLRRFFSVRAEHKAAGDLAEQLLNLAQNAQDVLLLLESHHALGASLFYLGEMASAHEQLARGALLYDPQQHRPHVFLYGVEPGVECLAHAAWVLWHLGYPDQALKRTHEALALAQESAHSLSLAVALTRAAKGHQYRREAYAVQERAEAAITLSAEQGYPLWLGFGTVLQGWALAEQGQAEEGVVRIRQGLAAFRATGAEVQGSYFLALLAEAYGKAGQAEEGLATLAEALAVVDKTEERFYEAELYRLKGELTLAQSKVQGPKSKAQEAEECFLKAVEIARKQQAKSLELRATVSLARFWQQQGKTAEAHHMLSEVYGWFTEGFDTKDLQEAKTLLEELSQ